MADPRVLGVDLGGTKTAVSVWTPDGTRLASRRFSTIPGPPEPNLERIEALGRELLGGARPASIGVSGGGPLDPERGIIISIPNLPGWTEVPIARRLSAAFGAPVGIENDANACAIAEHRFGAGRGSRNMVFLTLSTGIGGGLILDGRIYRGHRFLAGEAGHTTIVPDGPPCGCGNRGCLETFASGTGIARRLRERRAALAGAGGPPVDIPGTAKDVVDRARAGDAFSLDFLEETAAWLAVGLANLVYILDPERIVLGTIAVGAGDLLLAPLRAEVERRLWPAFRRDLQILPAALGADLGDWAAFAVAPAVAG
jgi:glucokinase